MKSISWGTTLPYFFIFYALPIMIMMIIGPHVNFTNPGRAWLLMVTLCSVLLLARFFSKLRIRLSLPLNLFVNLPNIYRSNTFLFATFVAVLPTAVLFATSYGIDFRYSRNSLSESGLVAIAAVIYRPFFSSLILYYFLMIISSVDVTKTQRALILAHVSNWFLFANGAVDVVWAAVALMIGVLGNSARSLFVTNKQMTLLSLVMGAIVGLVSVFVISGVVFLGYANKLGFDESIIIFREEFFERVLYYLYYRLSVFPSSLDLVLGHVLDFGLYVSALDTLFDNILYRLSVILQIPVARPEIESLNRLNYMLLFQMADSNSNTGASPGPLASFAYYPMLPFNLIFCAAYIAIILNTYSRLIELRSRERLSIFAMLFFTILNFAFLHNPITAFTQIGPELFRTALYILAMSLAFKQFKSTRN